MTVVAALVSWSRLCVSENLQTHRELLAVARDSPPENHMLTRRWRSAYAVGPAHQSEFHGLRSPASHSHPIPRTPRPRSEVAASSSCDIFGDGPKSPDDPDNFSGRRSSIASRSVVQPPRSFVCEVTDAELKCTSGRMEVRRPLDHGTKIGKQAAQCS